MLWRAQVVLKHASGLPRDNVTNTFWINDEGGPANPVVAEPIAELVRDFYTEQAPGAGIAMTNCLAPSIVNNGHEIKMTPIDVETGEDTRGAGFPPVWVETFDLIGRALGNNGTASEVALCLSFKNMASGAVPPAQRRGRVYFGPIIRDLMDTVGGITRPSAGFRNSLLATGVDLLNRVTADGKEWVVYSRPFPGRPETPRPGNPRGPLPALPARGGAVYPVTNLWVDDAFDTMRKRGEKASTRSVA